MHVELLDGTLGGQQLVIELPGGELVGVRRENMLLIEQVAHCIRKYFPVDAPSRGVFIMNYAEQFFGVEGARQYRSLLELVHEA